MASLVALLASSVARFLIPGFFSTPGLESENPFALALLLVVAAFLLPLLWWRTIIGYIGVIVLGIFEVVAVSGEVAAIAAAGGLSGELLYTIYIPSLVFALLLVGSSVLAWREG